MSKIIESVKKSARAHPYRYSIAAGLAAAVTLADVIGFAKNSTHDVPENACISPWSVSQTYENPNASPIWRAHQTGFGPSGVLVLGSLPLDAHGIQVSWKSPSDSQETLDQHASEMLETDEIGNFATKLAIGDGAVEFSVRAIAP